jgi:hypothetical protein
MLTKIESFWKNAKMSELAMIYMESNDRIQNDLYPGYGLKFGLDDETIIRNK